MAKRKRRKSTLRKNFLKGRKTMRRKTIKRIKRINNMIHGGMPTKWSDDSKFRPDPEPPKTDINVHELDMFYKVSIGTNKPIYMSEDDLKFIGAQPYPPPGASPHGRSDPKKVLPSKTISRNFHCYDTKILNEWLNSIGRDEILRLLPFISG